MANQSTDPNHSNQVLTSTPLVAQRPTVNLKMPAPLNLSMSRVPNEPFLRYRIEEDELLDQIMFARPVIPNTGFLGRARAALSNGDMKK